MFISLALSFSLHFRFIISNCLIISTCLLDIYLYQTDTSISTPPKLCSQILLDLPFLLWPHPLFFLCAQLRNCGIVLCSFVQQPTSSKIKQIIIVLPPKFPDLASLLPVTEANHFTSLGFNFLWNKGFAWGASWDHFCSTLDSLTDTSTGVEQLLNVMRDALIIMPNLAEA